ncbi:hypothetical protein [Spiroplasma endosymbiont of Diplazon laetatorius]|uniref:hypothetical protein n=1 Tax=Spiroplasma endosymbiont of Diplazon laetatorius TaxID=3066322 RepID=UPI0030CD2E76
MIIQVIGLDEKGIKNFSNYLSKKYTLPLVDISYFLSDNKQAIIDKYSDFIFNNSDFIIVGSMSNIIYSSFYKRDYLVWIYKQDETKIDNNDKRNKFNSVFKEYEIANGNKIIINSDLRLIDQEKMFLNILEKKDYEYIQGKNK